MSFTQPRVPALATAEFFWRASCGIFPPNQTLCSITRWIDISPDVNPFRIEMRWKISTRSSSTLQRHSGLVRGSFLDLRLFHHEIIWLSSFFKSSMAWAETSVSDTLLQRSSVEFVELDWLYSNTIPCRCWISFVLASTWSTKKRIRSGTLMQQVTERLYLERIQHIGRNHI